MDKAQSMIQLYRACFYVCMGVTILGFASAVFLFFRFDIRSIFEIRTGRAARRTIRKMAEANAMTGRLRPDDLDFTTGGLVAKTALDAPPAPNPGAPAPATAETVPLRTETAAGGAVQALHSAAPPAQPAAAPSAAGFGFTVTQSVMLIHTNEQI